MIYIKKNTEPEWLTEYKRRNPTATYDSESFFGYREQLRKELVKEQHNLCAYCCCQISDDKAHNEHIEPRNPRNGSSTKTLDYSNIVASCNNADRCGAKKGNDYEVSEFISPLNPECEDTFIYYPDGEMEGNDYTIGLLNLNSYELKEARKAVYHTLSKLDKSTIEMIYCQNDENLSPLLCIYDTYGVDVYKNL